jgi:hypothetical protein
MEFFIQLSGWTGVDLERLERTNGFVLGWVWEFRGNFVGKTWNFWCCE